MPAGKGNIHVMTTGRDMRHLESDSEFENRIRPQELDAFQTVDDSLRDGVARLHLRGLQPAGRPREYGLQNFDSYLTQNRL